MELYHKVTASTCQDPTSHFYTKLNLNWSNNLKEISIKLSPTLFKNEWSTKESLDCDSYNWSSGGIERSRNMLMELYHKVTASTCQEQYQVFYSGQDDFFFFFSSYFRQVERGKEEEKRGEYEESHGFEQLGSYYC